MTCGSDASLFDQSLLKVSGQVMEDSLIPPYLYLAKLAKSGRRGRSFSGSAQGAGSSRYTSPLEVSRPGPSGYGRRSASPACGGGAKRGRVGRMCLLLRIRIRVFGSRTSVL